MEVPAVAPAVRRRSRAACVVGLVATVLSGASSLRRVQADGPSVLFVTDSAALGLGDAAIKARLEATGYLVEVRPATSPTLGDVTGKTLVLVSASAPPASVAATFRDTLIPVVSWQSSIFDDMRMTGAGPGTDFGMAAHYTEVVFPPSAPAVPVPANPRHPGSLTAYLPRSPGIVAVTSAEGPFSWGKPAAAAWVVATLGVSSKAGIFAYEESDTMAGTPSFVAPARRVGLFMTAETAASFNDDGWSLFDAAVSWATFKNTPPVVNGGPDLLIDPRDQEILRGTVQDDGLPFSKAKSLTVLWTKQSGPGTPVFGDPDSAQTKVGFPPPSSPTVVQTYGLRLSASDGHLSNSVLDDRDVQVTVAFENRPPEVDVGFVASLTLPTSAALTATAIDEGLLMPMTYAWSVVEGPGSVTFSTPNALDTNATFGTKGVYKLLLSVADGFHTTTDDTLVEVKGNALLVVGNAETAGDTALKNRLQNLGYSVTVTLSSAVGTANADNRSVVVIAGTAVDASVAAKFKKVTQPVVVLKSGLFDDMLMTGATSGTHFGTSTNETEVTIAAPGSALAAGLFDTPATNLKAGTFSWGAPPPGATRVATLASDADKATIFAYVDGATMLGTFPAPGRRVGFFAQDAAAGSLTQEGGWLFDAAVVWASTMNRAPRANAGSDRGALLAVPGPTEVTLDGSAVDDGLPAPPGALSYQWTYAAGILPAEIVNPTAQQPTVLLPGAGGYEFRLTVSDGSLASSDEVKVYVSNPNDPPKVSISAQATTPLTASPTLIGTVVDDGLPNPPGALTLSWSKLVGPGTASFGSPSAATTTVAFSKKGVYTLQLLASDGALSTAATVNVDARQAALLVISGDLTGAGSEGNRYLVERLAALSYEADVRTGEALPDTAAVTAALLGKSLVVIAPSAVAADVGTKFRTRNTPVVVMKDELYADMAMTTAASHGNVTGQRQVAIALPGDAMAAGLGGTVTVADASTFGWGVTNANGVKVATLAADTTRATIFRYLSGVAMPGGIKAPARRVGFFAEQDRPGLSLDERGEALLEAAISWAASANMPPRITLPSALATRPNVALTLPGSVFHDGLPTATFTSQWAQQSGPGTAVFADPNLPTTTVTVTPAPGETLPQTYTLRLTVSDGELSAVAEADVAVHDLNQAPVVEVGPDLVGREAIVLPRVAQLAAIAYDDGLPVPPGALTLCWTKKAGPGTVAFGAPTSASTTARFDARGRYVLLFTATDGEHTSSDELVVDVESTAVLITAGPSVDPAEARLVARLESLGFEVGTVAALTATYSTADKVSIVVLSPLVTDADVNTKFRAVATPVIVTKHTLVDDMGMTTAVGSASATGITVALPSHPLAAGRASPPAVKVVSSAQPMGWGEGNGSQIRVGTVGAANRPALFGYEKGTVMPGLTAPERRAAFLLCMSGCSTAGALNAEGWAFFDATVRWVTTVNAAPRVVVGADQTITLPATLPGTATVTASVAWDDGFPDPPALTLAWDVAAGPAGVTFDTPGAAGTLARFFVPGTYILRLTARDGALAGSDTLTVNVLPQAVNAPPYVNAGPDQEVRLPNVATLRGLVADDGLGTGITTAWSQVLGPGKVTFANASSANTTATFPSTGGAYVLRLTGSDGVFTRQDEMGVVVFAAKTALIVNPALPTPDDTANSNAIAARLQGFGFTVTAVADANANLTSLASARNLVIVTQRVDPLAIGTRLTNVETPVIVARASLYPNMSMADSGIGEGVDFGESSHDMLSITDSDLPLAAGLVDRVTVVTQPSLLQWALNIRPTERAASMSTQTDRAAVFGYEKGETMLATLPAPGRRVGFFGSEATRFTAEGWNLFDRAVRWATEPIVPALFVYGSQSSENKRMSIRLAYLGYSVTRKLDSAVTATDALEKAVVVVSRSASGAVLGSKLRDVRVPVLTFDPENFNAMGMSGPTFGDDYGYAPDQVSLNILDATHPLAAVYKGVQEVLTGSVSTDFGWARTGPGARRVAVAVGFSYGATIFSYDRGALMPALTSAPERRVGFYINETVFTEQDVHLTDVGWDLFDAAVRWCGATDTDNDGLSNYEEFRAGTDPLNWDTNGDGVPDGSQAGTAQGATNLDMDGDGVQNSVELQEGTDPFNRDTDGDGVGDGTDCSPLDPARSTCPSSNPNDRTPPVITLQEPTSAKPFP